MPAPFGPSKPTTSPLLIPTLTSLTTCLLPKDFEILFKLKIFYKNCFFFLINIIYTIWVLVSIWNCAYNVKNKIWGDLSRVIVVLNVILLFLIYTGIISFDHQNIVQKNP